MRKLYILLFFFAASGHLFSQNYTFLGNATQLPGCNCYQLTSNSGDEAGAVFQNNTINLNNSFDFTFSNFFGCNGSSGADGEVFVLTTNPNGLGSSGGALGYGGSTQPCSFAIEFDTYQNTSAGDPSYNHTAYESGGQVTHNIAGPVSANVPSGYTLDNCQWHTIEIVWNANTHTMSDYVDGLLRIQQVVPNLITLLCGNATVNWGWSAGTGGSWNLQQVCMKTLSNWVAGINYQSCSPTIQFTDVGTSDTGNVTSYKWLFGDGQSSTLHNPTHTYADTGTYNASYIVTTANGCADTFSHPVYIAAPISLASVVVNPLCNGAQTGSVTLTASNGFGVSAGDGGYVYNWNNGDFGNAEAGVGAGTYVVTCTDGICTSTGSYTITQPTPVTATTSSTNASCNLNNGKCIITIAGGTPPYQNVTFAGITGTTVGNTTTVSGLPAGTYIANFTDANGCSALLQYTATIIGLPCGISANTSHTNVNCFGASTGSVTLTVSGSSPNETIVWKNSSGTIVGTTTRTTVNDTSTINNLPAGTYTYSYTDANAANAFTGTVIITQPPAGIVDSLSTNNVSCPGLNNGKATAWVISGGTAPYNYAWSGGQPNNIVANNLGAGAISVVVTDALGCTATASGNITSPPALQLNITTTSNACNAYNDGTAAANVTGGSPPYSYYWNNISTADTDLSLGAGTYTVTVTDSSGCTITQSATIPEAVPFINSIDSTNVNCYGDSTGTITVNSSGGAPPYTYQWSLDSTGVIDPNLTTSSLTNLKAGTYLLTVTDANGCVFGDSTFIQQPASPLTLAATITNVTCHNANNGEIILTLGGGTPPYMVPGIPVPIPPGVDTLQNLPDTVITETVTDSKGCTINISDTITQPGPQSLTVTETDASCNGGHDGTATANFTNPTGTVSYDWNNSATGATISNLDSATYDVIATDANGCSFIGSTTINQPPALTMTTVVADPPCFGAKGFVTATPAAGGTAPFVYTWSYGASTTNTDSVPAGNYGVISIDVNSCRQTATFSVSQPVSIALQVSQTNVSCFGGNNGAITIIASGGTGPTYTYNWNPNVSSTGTATALTAGPYIVSVTDQAGCIVDTTVNITQPAQPLSAVYIVNNVACNGGSTGAIHIATSGGTPGYTYGWTPNVSGSDSATGLSANILYSVLITDTNNCTIDSSFTLTQPLTPLTIDSSHSNLSCYGSNNGLAVGSGMGGTPPYTYSWTSSNSTADSATNLAAGDYAVIVTDDNHCTATVPFVITQPTQIVSTKVDSNVRCFGQATGSITLTTTGGVPGPGYTYTWSPNVSNDSAASGLAAGVYLTTITDATNCTATLSTNISQAPAFTVDTISTPVKCFGGSNGTITVTAAGGVPPFNYSASNGNISDNSTTGDFTNLTAGDYMLVVTDQNGCPDTTSATVSHPVPLVATVSYYNPTCRNSNNGSIKIEATGGNPVYNYSITGQGPSSMGFFNGLSAGDYTVTVSDIKGCDTTQQVTLVQPDTIWVNAIPVDGSVKLGDTLDITSTTNQSGNISYSWWPNFGLSCYDCPDPVFDGVYSKPYTVTITNDSGCTASYTINITVIPNYSFYVPNAFTPNGDGKNDFWQIYGETATMKQLEVQVFDRIGEKVFESEDVNFMWDGTFNGKPAPMGVYVYEIKIVWNDNTANSNTVYKGSITLLK